MKLRFVSPPQRLRAIQGALLYLFFGLSFGIEIQSGLQLTNSQHNTLQVNESRAALDRESYLPVANASGIIHVLLQQDRVGRPFGLLAASVAHTRS